MPNKPNLFMFSIDNFTFVPILNHQTVKQEAIYTTKVLYWGVLWEIVLCVLRKAYIEYI